MPITKDIADLQSARIRALNDYWTALRGDRFAPRRAEVDPAQIIEILPYLMITEIEPAPFRVRYRLVGTRVVELTGFEFTGRYLDELGLLDDGKFEECYRIVATDRVPVFNRAIMSVDQWSDWHYDLGIFPLSNDGTTVTNTLTIECYDTLERHPTRLGLRRF